MWTCPKMSWPAAGPSGARRSATLTGWLRRYTAMVTSGSQGAVLAV